MSDFDDLGEQTATVFRRRRVKAQDYADTGTPEPHEGCQLVPIPPEEQVAQGLTVRRRWRFAGPAGFTARAQDQAAAVPGPTNEDGRPLRLGLDGPTSPAYDLDGAVDHVEAMFVTFDV